VIGGGKTIGPDSGEPSDAARKLRQKTHQTITRIDQSLIAVQINGKLRSRIFAPPETSDDELRKMALEDERAGEYTKDKDVVTVIVIPNRLVNIVVRG
jgi:leucyl-tRNA synthetase